MITAVGGVALKNFSPCGSIVKCSVQIGFENEGNRGGSAPVATQRQ